MKLQKQPYRQKKEKVPIWLLPKLLFYDTLVSTKTAKNEKSADVDGGGNMDYGKMQREIVNKIPEDTIFSRQDLSSIAFQISADFKETLLRNLLEKLLSEGQIVRVGRNQYQKRSSGGNKNVYINSYSEEAQIIVNWMQEKYPLLEYRIWELSWLNEFWNHQIAQNKIFVEVERMGCEFVYTELNDEYDGHILLRPDEKELYRYAGPDTVIIDRLVSEAPKGNPDEYNMPLEKLIVDLFANKNLRSMVHIGEYAKAIAEMFDKYYIDQVKLFRYAKRRHKKEEICRFLADEAGVELITEG